MTIIPLPDHPDVINVRLGTRSNVTLILLSVSFSVMGRHLCVSSYDTVLENNKPNGLLSGCSAAANQAARVLGHAVGYA